MSNNPLEGDIKETHAARAADLAMARPDDVSSVVLAGGPGESAVKTKLEYRIGHLEGLSTSEAARILQGQKNAAVGKKP